MSQDSFSFDTGSTGEVDSSSNYNQADDVGDGTISGAMERREKASSRVGDMAAKADAALMGKGATKEQESSEDPAIEAAKEEKRRIKLKLKVDGQESEEEFDESTVAKAMQLQKTAYKRLEEAAKKESAWQAERQQIMDRIAPILKDPKAWARELIADEIRQEAMTPEQRRIEQYERELEHHRTAEEQRRNQELEVELNNKTQFEMQRIGQEINAALKEYDLPETAESVRMIIDCHRRLNMPFSVAAQYVSNQLEETTKNIFAKMSPEAIERYLGKDRMASLRKWDVERVRDARAGKPKQPQPQPRSQGGQRQHLNEDAARHLLAQRFGQ